MINNKKAFTMLEVMAVILIVGLLGAVAAPQFLDYRQEARHAAAAMIEGNMLSAIKLQTTNAIIRCDNPTLSNPSLEALIANDITVDGACAGIALLPSEKRFLATDSEFPPTNPVNGLNTIGLALGVPEDKNFYTGTCSSEFGGVATGWCYNPYTGSIWASTNESATANPGGPALSGLDFEVPSSSSASVASLSSASSESSSSVSSAASSASVASSSSNSSEEAASSASASASSSSLASSAPGGGGSSSQASSASGGASSSSSSVAGGDNVAVTGGSIGDTDDDNNGHGNDEDRCDDGNPGNGDECVSSSSSSSVSGSIVGTSGALDDLLMGQCSVAYASVSGGGSSMSLTPLGTIYDNGAEAYSVWRIRNPSNSSMTVRLTGNGTLIIDNMTIASDTDVYVKSPIVSGAATHLAERLNIVDGIVSSVLSSDTDTAQTTVFSSSATVTCAASSN